MLHCVVLSPFLDQQTNQSQEGSEPGLTSSGTPEEIRDQIIYAIEKSSPKRQMVSKRHKRHDIESTLKEPSTAHPMKPSPSLQKLICFEQDLVHEEQPVLTLESSTVDHFRYDEDMMRNRYEAFPSNSSFGSI
jgi:hypothetical protein